MLPVFHLLLLTFLFSLLSLHPSPSRAAEPIRLGVCTSSTTGCSYDLDVYGDPNGDQGIPPTDKAGHNIPCLSFKALVSNIKVCACDKCAKCPADQCNAVANGACGSSGSTGQFRSVCKSSIT
ncbi:hypothetical protein BDZ90DRAFT_232544 [Jaminaea rosea]|uniref:Uncharacterized protein n=1 Tax=Jaminaea rosea TaxID=1569628 RepID=A0A316UV27_9BASI|nr:hypothetical protein BDZ90DRAFT_232544 [Jaminaea rosea]PWN26965.1 hypothetical protein BDZ90DRAFT_232544 [Jaminaea rosea]